MSVSLAMIPVALTLRVVMGKDRFEQFAESMQRRTPVAIETEIEILRLARKAGYRTEKHMGIFKSYISGTEFVVWEKTETGWQIIVPKHLEHDDRVKQLMKDMEKIANRSLFNQQLEGRQGQPAFAAEPGNFSAGPMITYSGNKQAETFPTNFRDGELLFRTLKEFGVNPFRYPDGRIICKVDGTELTFSQSEPGVPFSVSMDQTPGLEEVFRYLSDLDEDYKKGVQAMVYDHLKQRITDHNLSVEQEEVLDDHSIVITLNIER